MLFAFEDGDTILTPWTTILHLQWSRVELWSEVLAMPKANAG